MRRCRLFCVAAIAVLALPVLCAHAEDKLWSAYSQGSAKKRAVLSQCLESMENIRDRAASAADAPNWSQDPDVQCLLSHRVPAVLVVEKEFERTPAGFHLDAVLLLTTALDDSRLRRHLPELLAKAKDHRSQLQVLKAMGDLRDAESSAAVEQFLADADAITPEDLVCEAARGLALTGDGKYRPVLARASRLVESDQGRLQVAAARYLCSEPEMAQEILRILELTDADLALRMLALEFFMQNPVQDAIPVLARLAGESEQKEVAGRAMCALMNTTGFSIPSAAQIQQPTAETGDHGTGSEVEPEPEEAILLTERELAELPAAQRRQLVETVLEWWREHKDMTPQPRHIDRREALAVPDKSKPH
jgi:hypothetical protein